MMHEKKLKTACLCIMFALILNLLGCASRGSIGINKASPEPGTSATEMEKSDFFKSVLRAEKAKNWPEMGFLSKKFLERHPHDPVALRSLGEAYSAEGKDALAIPVLEEAIKISESDPWFDLALGEAYFKINNPDKAKEYLQAALKKKPDYVSALCDLGTIYDTENNKDLAESYFKRCIVADPSNAEGWQARSRMAMARNSYEEGLSYAEKGLERNPKNPFLLYYKGSALFYLNRHAEAIETFSSALYIDPYNGWLHQGLGEIYLAIGPVSKAISELKMAHQALPNDFRTMAKLAIAYKTKGDKNGIMDVYRDLKKINPQLAEDLYAELLSK